MQQSVLILQKVCTLSKTMLFNITQIPINQGKNAKVVSKSRQIHNQVTSPIDT